MNKNPFHFPPKKSIFHQILGFCMCICVDVDVKSVRLHRIFSATDGMVLVYQKKKKQEFKMKTRIFFFVDAMLKMSL